MPTKSKPHIDEALGLLEMYNRIITGTNLTAEIQRHDHIDTKRDEGPQIMLRMSLRQMRQLDRAFRQSRDIVRNSNG